MMTEMLYIPTLTPRPLDSMDRTARKYYRAVESSNVHIQGQIENNIRRDCTALGLDFRSELDDTYNHGCIVSRFARCPA